MRFISKIVTFSDWVVTLFVSYLLLQFGTDQISRLVASRYVVGNFSEVDGWLSLLGVAALIAICFLIHPRTRFHTAAGLAVLLVGESLRTLGYGEPLEFSVPLVSLAAATLVVLSSRVGKQLERRGIATDSARGYGSA